MKPQKRITDPATIDKAFIDRELKKGSQVIVQFSDKLYDARLLADINQLCLKYDDSFAVRFFAHHGETFDCNTVSRISNVKALSIDCMTKANNIDAITKLSHLQRVGIGIFEMKETEILSAENLQQVHELLLTETKTKAFNLDYLRNYKNLSSLIVCSHTKNIGAIGMLKDLKSLRLSSISKVPLDFVNALKRLHFLGIILGGRDNILEIKENEIEHLELIWIRGLNDLSNLGNFKKLRSLHVEDHIRLPNIHFDTQLTGLNDVKIINCKTLSSVTGLENLPMLKQLRIAQTDIDFNNFVKQSFPASLNILAFYTGKSKIDATIKERLAAIGYVDGLDRNY